jgi:hypothetical protein
MTSIRKVRFAEVPIASIHIFPVFDDETCSRLYYNVEDYRRFRIERAQEELLKITEELQAKTAVDEMRRPGRRDSLTGAPRRPVRYHRQSQEKGVAKAA